MCLVNEAFDRVARNVLEWGIGKKGMPEVLVRSVNSLYEGAKTRVRVDYELSGEFDDKVGCTKDPFCHLFLLQWW